MKFKYNNIEVSYKIDLSNDLDKIKVHAASFIRGANINTDNSKKYEVIDETLITLLPENLEEETYLNKHTIDDNSSVVENWEICRGNIFSLTTSTTNGSSPGWATIGNNINGLIFADSKNQNVSTSFDLGSKYKAGTPLFLDLCYVPMSTSTGKILFKVEYNKGIPNTNANELIANNTILTYEALNNNIVGNYKRISIELDSSNLDVNGMLIANIGRAGTNTLDTYVGTFALLTASLRYKIGNTYSIKD